MASAATKRELDKVKLGKKRQNKSGKRDEPDSASDTESDQTDIGEDEPEYFPDAIKWARYRNSQYDRPDGYKGWHYGVLWQGFLKSVSDTEEPIANFDFDENGKNQMLIDFWDAVGKPLKVNEETGVTNVEPSGRIGQVILPPKELSMKWIKEARPRRSHKRFLARQKKEKNGQKIQKRDSDYYWLRDIRRKKGAEFAVGSSTPTSTAANTPVDTENDVRARQKMKEREQTAGSSSQNVPVGDGKGKGKAIAKVKGKEPEKRARELDSLFSDEEVVAEKRTQELESLFSDEEVVVIGGSKKRKSPQPTAEPSTATSTSVPVSNTGRLSPTKRQKTPPRSTPQPPKQITTIAQTSINASQPSLSATKSVSNPPTTKNVSNHPTTKTVSNPTPLTTKVASTPAPRTTTPVPTTTTTASVPTNRQNAQEPLFLDDAPSPVASFQPLPGIFDLPHQSPTATKPGSPKISTPPPAAPQPHESSRGSSPAQPMDTSAKESGATKGETLPSPPPATATAPAPASLPTPPATQLSTAVLDAPMSAVEITTKVSPEQATTSTTESMVEPSAAAESPHSEPMDIDVEEQSVAPPPPPPPAAAPVTEKETTPDVIIPSPTRESPLQSPDTHQSASPPHEITPMSPPRFGFGDAPKKAPKQIDTNLPRATTSTITPASPPSPPRYGFGDAPKKTQQQLNTKVPKPTSPTKSKEEPLSPVKSTIPLADRPKYVQPRLVKTISEIVDPEAEVRRQKLAASQARKGSGSTDNKQQPSRHALPVRPAHIVPPPPSRQAPTEVRSAPPAGAYRPPFHHPDRPIPATSHIPSQPKSWGGSTPSGPSAPHPRPPMGYGHVGAGPLPDQKQSCTTGRVPPHVQRQAQGGMSPVVPGNMTPVWGGGSPLVSTDRWRPTNTSPYMSNRSPQWSSNPPIANQQFPPGFPSPLYGAPPGFIAPGPRAAYSPMHNGGSATPNPAVPQAVDPRRALPPTTPLQYPTSPTEASSASGSVRIDCLGHLSLRLEGQESNFRLDVMRGALPYQHQDGDAVLARTFGGGHREILLQMDKTELSLVEWQMRQGARVVQWAKLAGIGEGEAKRRWESVKTQSHEFGKTWVAFTELPQADETITAHYALLVTSAENLGALILAPNLGLGLGPWSDLAAVGVALIVLALPLTSGPPPTLPNPVRPDTMVMTDFKPKMDMISGPDHILATYGLSPQYFSALTGRRAITYPSCENECDALHRRIDKEFLLQNVLPHDDRATPEHVLFKNNKMARAVKSSTVKSTANRRTQYFAVGPAMHLAPSQWGLTEIWKTGGLVTFSPTMILRHPDKFHEIMNNIRVAPNWAAYVIPEVVQWVAASWKTPTRCPKPTKAYQTFTKSLFLDHHLYALAGNKASAGGGLAVSVCPPHCADTNACARWMEWLARVADETEYQALANLCLEYNNPTRAKTGGMNMDIDIEIPELDLIDIETKQMEDLTAMRMRPHLLPYRRYIHIGEVSFSADKKSKLSAGIECIDPESFAAVLSGAI